MYTFNKNSFHVKFFQWLWGVNPVYRYKTMCPYFWQYVGTILILPLILIYKSLSYVISPIRKQLDLYFEERDKLYIQSLYDEISKDMTLEEKFRMSNRRCFKKYFSRMWDNNYDENLRDKLWDIYYIEREVIPVKKKIDTQKITDKLIYGIIGKIIGTSILLVLATLLGWGIYEILHLFTMSQFVVFLQVSGLLIAFLGVIYGIIKLVQFLIIKLTCNTPLKNVVFWTHIGNFLLSVLFFVINGIRMTFDMIKNFYKNQCPMISWKDDEE